MSHILYFTELESMSASRIPSSDEGSRHASEGQMKFLEALVKKHGTNVKTMAADLKLNPEQRSAGQIRRALKNAGHPVAQPDFEPTD
jgi:hypothetical protein